MTINEQTLYKYRAYSARALEMLVRRKFYFAKPAQLNDPYDCRINIRNSLAAAINRAGSLDNQELRKNLSHLSKIKNVYANMDADLVGLGILSLSKNPTNSLMWSHYSDNHRGFCVGFQLSDKFTAYNEEEKIFGAAPVSYCVENPFFEFLEDSAQKLPEYNEYWVPLLDLGMRTKAKAWVYEEEVRVIRAASGEVKFAPSELTEIIFGLNMATANKETIRMIVSGSDWQHLHFKEIVRSDGFELQLSDVT